MMKDYEGRKLKFIERNLMRGVFQRKLKDFQEESIDISQNKTLLSRLKDQFIISNGNLSKLKLAAKSGLLGSADGLSKISTNAADGIPAGLASDTKGLI